MSILYLDQRLPHLNSTSSPACAQNTSALLWEGHQITQACRSAKMSQDSMCNMLQKARLRGPWPQAHMTASQTCTGGVYGCLQENGT